MQISSSMASTTTSCRRRRSAAASATSPPDFEGYAQRGVPGEWRRLRVHALADDALLAGPLPIPGHVDAAGPANSSARLTSRSSRSRGAAPVRPATSSPAAIQDVDLAGNFYAVADGGVVRRLPPHYVTIILGSQREPQDPSLAWDADVIGYEYAPRRGERVEGVPAGAGRALRADPRPAWPRFRGMSWLTPVLREITADNAMTAHQRKYFEQGATPNVVVTIPDELCRTPRSRGGRSSSRSRVRASGTRTRR